MHLYTWRSSVALLVIPYMMLQTCDCLLTDHSTEEIVIPFIVDSDGSFVSHELSHHVRHKRSSTLSSSSSPYLYVNITGFGQTFHIDLKEEKELLAPGFKVYHRQNNVNSHKETFVRSQEKPWDETRCHFSGKVRSHRGTAALSVCDGMRGIIRTADEDYIIEPHKSHKVKGHGQPHKMYKRSSLPQKQYYDSRSSRHKDNLYSSESNHDSSINKRSLKSEYNRHKRKDHLADRTVETLVVADKNLYQKHGDQNITTYTLTLFNMVAELFRDRSLGNKVSIVLVGLIILEGDEPGLTIGYHADKTLNSFCSWQAVLEGDRGRQHDHAILMTGMDLCSYKNSPCDTLGKLQYCLVFLTDRVRQHDHAILMTGMDLCSYKNSPCDTLGMDLCSYKNSPCDTLGFAPIEGMCNRVRSCTINEDTGLTTAFTIAHEMGHNFGMFHDGEGNYCSQSAGKLMSPTLVSKDGLFQWSICSKAYLMRFLNTPQAQCLSNHSKNVAELSFPDKLPGELYDADMQCKWQFGNKAKLCGYDFGKDICKSLWCFRGRQRCETKFLPAAEGTSCGHGRWCRQGACVKFGQHGPSPVDGGWSEWSIWSECSRSCGGGVTKRERQCNKPLPQYGGMPCQGDDKVYKMCNIKVCPNGDGDFYDVQCTSYNKEPYRGWYLKWKPNHKLYDFNEPCILHCYAETYSYVFNIKHTAVDGMKCMDKNNLCINGVCKPIGCDWIVGSNASNDICGVCRGDNSTCRILSGEYTEQPKLNTYFPIAVLPKTARSIKIKENALSSNYLAIRDIFGKYLLNGEHRVAWPGEYKIGGAKFYYSRPYNEPETLTCDGPLTEDLVLEILVQDKNPGISYEYALPIDQHEKLTTKRSDMYSWSISVTACSEPCAGGSKTVSAFCRRNHYEEVDPAYCDSKSKPETGIFSCNQNPCPPRWVPEGWRECTKKCGGGKQKRKIMCRQKHSMSIDKAVKKKFCRNLPKPIKKRPCNSHACPPRWFKGKWSKCSVSCGEGTWSRKVVCKSKGAKGVRGNNVIPDDSCHGIKPNITESCKKDECPPEDQFEWHLSPWGPCSQTCGDGSRSRYLRCKQIIGDKVQELSSNRMCFGLDKPDVAMVDSCHLMPCPVAYVWLPQWHTRPWSQCSVTCGEGEQRRQVRCLNMRNEDASGCEIDKRPSASQTCKLQPCKPKEVYRSPVCEDKYPWCHLVREHNVCRHHFYGSNCCKTCHGIAIKHRT
ncbi:A disintegrin and metalloproteinase with thrombospondin motifs 5,A disintegrin and metalloproteinase with thrombospondin motifs 18,A disintegrin and metalloproteinase with thrombospondin motifs 16 [Mytilus coruscus]|uniref:A disintegrin and metalloproteinase with thrombospondin motifs 5,A disintegrin and metalloproteinase with thrombospondin motifs 18,A disintegrin and metalloproteinase with thrombospondin motifs 16 n=1 Tax=Mytilus coruscus TaxID=42192 RepID=A0A6J8CSF8_MYTCO|nr:A disintegrin and metalloproteinase with thrombospondin motifs 5,A disintegrin and metalloproteinase with thrombospondin motifs 18,A disintegrin and metalloproteinase with thrombospondin motifs 16 [Mytilus coruscus]